MTTAVIRYPAAREFFQDYLADKDVSGNQLVELLYPGEGKKSNSMSYWMYGYGRANNDTIMRLAKVLRMPVAEIEALYAERVDPPVPVVKQVLALPVAEPQPFREPPATPVLSVIMLSSGKMRIKLDVELDHKDGLPLAQMLYGVHGLIREET